MSQNVEYSTGNDTEVPHSITNSLSQLSVLNIFGWFALFAAVTLGSVYLMNCFMKYREARAEQEPGEEVTGLVPLRNAGSGSGRDETSDTTAIPVSSDGASSSRRNFLQQRREAAQKSYGTA